MRIDKFYENPAVLHVNCCENRAYYIPYSDEETALGGVREDSDRFHDLCGTWKFGYFNNVYECPEFVTEGLNDYSEIPVPSNWQMLGYDRHQYTNTRYPFPYDPPYVPQDNPCGAYVKEFDFNKGGARYYLNFEGVDSCFYVWLNGVFVGYSQVSHSTSEFDITDVLENGKNTLCVLVLKWCDGSYLEDQDKFRMSGIFRSVYILERNEGHIRDFFIRTKIDGTVSIDTYGTNAEAIILDNGIEIASGSGSDIQLKIDAPVLWNAEEPYLYTLVIRCAGEVIVQRIGIREIKIENGVVYLNGKKVRMLGTNRHDSDPETGYVISYEQAMKDLRMMKEHNMNALRTSHYPNAPWMPEICDEIGLYVVDESDIECHGCCSFYGASQEKTFGLIAQDPRFYDAILDRIQRCVTRDKNRTSVLLWSLGNESGYGRSFELALEWLKNYDETRLTHYESSVHETLGHKNDTSLLDVYSTMYASPEWIEEYFSDEKNTKPYMQCEYIHAMGNGPGGIEDYTALMDKHDGFFAAFVWEWCDHAIYMGEENGRKKFYYGGDSGEYPHDENFCMDGLVYPDRRPHTGLLEFKNNIRPIRASLKNTQIVFENRLDFVNANKYADIRYELLENGKVVSEGEFEIDDIEPKGTATADIPAIPNKNADYALKITYYQKTDGILTKAGRDMGFDFLVLKEAEPETVVCGGSIDISETETEISISGAGFEYVYDKLRGVFKSFIINGTKINKTPLEWNIWRAPTDNDRNVKQRWKDACFDRALTRAYESEAYFEDNCVIIRTTLAVLAVHTQRIVDIDARWTVKTDGSVKLSASCKKNDTVPFIPRFGLRMFLPKCFDRVKYYGYGPYESYEDKKEASYMGAFESSVADLHEDYIKPQENGSHCGCKQFTIMDGERMIEVRGDGFSFNASEYTQEELTEKQHNYELKKCGDTVLCIDYRQSGIGSNSCGPELPGDLRLEGEFEFEIQLEFKDYI